MGVEPRCLAHSLGTLPTERKLPGQAKPCCHLPVLSLPTSEDPSEKGEEEYGLDISSTSSLPPSAHSSCQMAMWPTWASWRQAPTPIPPQDLQELPWLRAAMLWPPLWTSSVSRANCFAPEAPARWTARVQEHLPPPWLGARPEVSVSSWTVKSDQAVAGPGLFIDAQRSSVTVWETGAKIFGSSPGLTSCMASPQYYFHFGGGNLAPRGGRREWARVQQLFQCVNP